MSSLGIGHPDDGLLLRYIDGELQGRKVRQVERHLEACWQCRTELQELESTVAVCVRYRKTVLETHLPDPPNPWPDLYREFARIDSSSNAGILAAVKQLAARLRPSWGDARIRQWAVATAAALVMVCAVWYQFRETPSVQAAALLKRAVLAADAQASPVRRIQIRTKTQKLTRTVGAHRTPVTEASTASLEARFQAAHYDWNDPLSAKSFQGWRDSAPGRQDEVTITPDQYQIRTVASAGELAVARLILRSTDLRPVEERLEFRDQEWVELSDITDATTPGDGRSVATNVEPPVRLAVPSRPADTPAADPVSDELEVLAALHEIGADLGDPVEVKRSGGRVLVSGVGLPPARQKAIHSLLDTMPNVTVQFSEPADSAPGVAVAPSTATAPDTPTTAGVSAGLQARVEQLLGGHAEFQRFSSQVLDRNETMMSRVYALRRLAERFPSDAGMGAKDREVLRDLAREHASALAKDVNGLEHALRPLLLSLGASALPRAAPSTAAWQDTTEPLFQASHRVEVMVAVLLGVTPGDSTADRLPSDLMAALGQLRADLDTCQRSLVR